MVIGAILGGLGNQMFQYAAARALSLERGEALKLDLAGFANYGLHNGYELRRVFGIDAPEASAHDVRTTLGWRSPDIVRKILKRKQFAGWRGKHLAVEPHFQYWAGLERCVSPLYMLGYWQSERYFAHRAADIRKDFRFRAPLAGTNAEMADAMSGERTVSVHVRRGDYVSHKKTAQIMQLCSKDYYRRAVGCIEARIGTPDYFVFSDDVDWVRRNFDFLHGARYVDFNRAGDSYLDMQLMSLCRHHILANSSFSWWGAWLDARSDKTVIAPREWFRDSTSDADLLPAEWIRL